MRDLNEDTIIILDANILLNFYIMSSKLKKQILDSLRKVESNLWMPYQVGYEFHMNRKNKKIQFENTKKEFIKKLDTSLLDVLKSEKKAFEKSFSKSKDFITDHEDVFKNFEDEVADFINRLSEKFVDESANNDPIEEFSCLFEGKVNSMENNDYDSWEKEAIDRYSKKIPPGYEDETKVGLLNFSKKYAAKYGDFFLWKEILEYAKTNNIRNVVFVTEDLKEDWFYETKGAKIGPRIELIKELLDVADAKLRIYRTETFLSHLSASEEELNNEILLELREISRNERPNYYKKVEKENKHKTEKLKQMYLFDVIDTHEVNKIYDDIRQNIEYAKNKIYGMKKESKYSMILFHEEYINELDNISQELERFDFILGLILEEIENDYISKIEAKKKFSDISDEVDNIIKQLIRSDLRVKENNN